jgi:probable addiction module antidote protein
MATTQRTDSKVVKTAAPSIKAFDLSDYLDDEDMQTEYLNQVLQDGNAAEFTRAVGHIARARGMAQLARDTGLGRESLYKALSADAKPRFETVFKVMQALGLKLQTATVG